MEEGYDKLYDKAKEGVTGAIDRLPGSAADVLRGGLNDFDFGDAMSDVQAELTGMANELTPKLGPGATEGSSQFATPGFGGGNAIENLAIDAAADAIGNGLADAAEDAMNSVVPRDMPIRAAIDFKGLTEGGEAVFRGGLELALASCTEEEIKSFKLGFYQEYRTGFFNDSPAGRRYAEATYKLWQSSNGTTTVNINAQLGEHNGESSGGGSLVVEGSF